MSEKKRLDAAVFELGLTSSRERARAYIMAREITVNGVVVDKPGTSVSADAVIELKSDPVPFVSRGGLKLAKALKAFCIDPTGCICIDVGASTGGFTDCLLQNGAQKVFSVDVGYGQFAYSLRNDPRVVVIERMNFRHIPYDTIGCIADLIVTDVSFISITKLAEKFKEFADEKTRLVALIKPQFESEKNSVSKKGVITDADEHKKIVKNVISNLSENEIYLNKLDYSPIKGPKGNIEFVAEFLFAKPACNEDIDLIIDRTVTNAHAALNNKAGD